MNEFELNNAENKLRIEVYSRSKGIYLSVDDPENKCDHNNYEGDYAAIELTYDQVKALSEFLNLVINEAGEQEQ